MSLGHRKIGGIFRYNDPRFNYLYKELSARGMAVKDFFYLQEEKPVNNNKYLLGSNGLDYFMQLKNRPTVILVHNDTAAIGAMHQARQIGLELPREMSIIGFDDIAVAEYVVPSLTTFQHSAHENIAKILLERIMARIKSPEMAVEKTIEKTKLIIVSGHLKSGGCGQLK